MNLEEFATKISLTGEWVISYHDASHLPPLVRDPKTFASDRLKKTVTLGNILIDDVSPDVMEQGVVPFTFTLASREEIEKQFHEHWSKEPREQLSTSPQIKKSKKGKKDSIPSAEYCRTAYGEIAESLIRTRICRPEIDQKDWRTLADRRNLIFITDTSIIRRGVVSYLADIFENKPTWVIVPVVSMLELQEASGRVRFTPSDSTDAKKFKSYLGQRPMSTSSTRELLILRRKQVPVEFLEVPPELLKYYGGPEEKILKDRMILEGVKRIIKEKSTAEKIYLLSGDVDMVRFAKLENIEAIYADKRQLEGGEQFYSAHYDFYKRGFVACGAHEFLWDLAHVFSFIKADNPTAKKTITLDYYFAGKNVKDWEEDILEVAEQEHEPAA